MSWPLVKIGDVCHLMTGGTPKTTISEYYENGTVPWIVSGDIHKGEIFDCDKKITELAVEKSNARYLPKDSVLIALNGQGKTRGTVALLRTSNATCNQSIVSINPNDQRELFSDYLFYFLKSQYRQIRNITGDKDRAGLNMPLIRSIEIPLPPLDEQKRIAAILDKADAIRRKRQQAIYLADDFLRSVFLDMFGDPVANPKRLELVAFSSIADFINGDRSSNYPSGSDLIEEGVLFLSTKNIVDNQLNFKETAFISQEKFESLSRGKLKKKDLVITLRGTLGSCAIFDSDFDTGFINAQIMILRCKQQVLPEYLHALLTSNPIHSMFQRIGQGAAVPQLTASQLKELRLPIPPIESQKKFIGVLEVSKKLIAKFSSKDRNLLFDSLSQQAFAGEL